MAQAHDRMPCTSDVARLKQSGSRGQDESTRLLRKRREPCRSSTLTAILPSSKGSKRPHLSSLQKVL